MNEFILCIALFYLFLILHEFCHLFIYVIHGVAIKRFYVFPFDFKLNHSKKISVTLFATAGVVIPTFKEINQKEKNIIFSSLISAPIMHTIMSTIGIILYTFMSKIIFFYVFAINLLMLISTFIENKYAVGDSLAAYYIYTSHDKANKIYNGLLE
jgi:hypothetical protein